MTRLATISKTSGGECCVFIGALQVHLLINGRVRCLGGETGFLLARQGAADRLFLLPAILKALQGAGYAAQRLGHLGAA